MLEKTRRTVSKVPRLRKVCFSPRASTRLHSSVQCMPGALFARYDPRRVVSGQPGKYAKGNRAKSTDPHRHAFTHVFLLPSPFRKGAKIVPKSSLLWAKRRRTFFPRSFLTTTCHASRSAALLEAVERPEPQPPTHARLALLVQRFSTEVGLVPIFI